MEPQCSDKYLGKKFLPNKKALKEGGESVVNGSPLFQNSPTLKPFLLAAVPRRVNDNQR